MTAMSLRVVLLASECEPWAKTGGLADVVDALARALGQLDDGSIDGLVDVFLPNYAGMRVPDGLSRAEVRIPDPLDRRRTLDVGILSVETHGYRLRLVDYPPAFDREGIYGPPAGDHPDNAFRFGLLCRAALESLRTSQRPPDVIHIHDWHTGPAIL